MSERTDGLSEVAANGHRYPTAYGPGQNWALDMAWEALDRIKPGAIPDDVRCFLAGQITGMLMAVKDGRRP